MAQEPGLKTPLYDLHVAHGGKIVSFGGYDLPLHYHAGILKEHLHTRAAAALFDVSHMGQALLRGSRAASLFETLAPTEIGNQPQGRIRYTMLTNAQGGIIDDLMVTQGGDSLYLVVNASRKAIDFAHISDQCGDAELEILEDMALLALQGPHAARILATLVPGIDRLHFMHQLETTLDGIQVRISRSGYTGEDGYEISVDGDFATDIAELLLAQDGVALAGLGARDSLRMEAGLALYGHELDDTISPIEAGLLWTIPKSRRERGGFIGAEFIQNQIQHGAPRKKIGIRFDDRLPAREGAPILSLDGTRIGHVTSGGFAPSLNAPIAIGLVETEHGAPGNRILVTVRDKHLNATICAMPFVPHGYYKG